MSIVRLACILLASMATLGCSDRNSPAAVPDTADHVSAPVETAPATAKENVAMSDDMPSPSRPSAPQVEAIEHNGIRYQQDMERYRYGGTQPGGYLVAIDLATGERQWMLKVYEVPEHDAAGVSSPGRYFRSMRLLPGGDEIEIVNEVGGTYLVNLSKRSATWVSGPDSVHE